MEAVSSVLVTVQGPDERVELQLPATFRPQGWLNGTTLIGVVQTLQAEGDMALVRLEHPTRMEDLGFHGFFVGVVQGS